MSKRIMAAVLLLTVTLLASCGAVDNTAESTIGTESIKDISSEAESSTSATAVPEETVTDILMTFGEVTVTATLDDSPTTNAFLERLPLTLTMSRYADREYYAAIDALPQGGEAIEDYENGDITFYTAGSLAVYFAGEETSSQSGLIRMGKITSDLSAFDAMPDTVEVTITLVEGGTNEMNKQNNDYDFTAFPNVEITGIMLSSLSEDERSVLYTQARYCQAMTDADTETMREIVPESMTFTHMSGMQQTREEYFADIENGSLNYFTIGIENPQVTVDGDKASVTFTSILNANAYGARGTYRMSGTHHYEKQNGNWMAVNSGKE